jgi:hypothetical protein
VAEQIDLAPRCTRRERAAMSLKVSAREYVALPKRYEKSTISSGA